MNVVIQTAPRKVDLLPLTIDSIRKEWKGNLHIMHPDSVMEQELQGIQKAAYGFYRCLTLDKTKPLFRVEDDVILKENWLQILKKGIESVEKERKEKRYIISFIKPFNDCVADPNLPGPMLQTFIYRSVVSPTGVNEIPVMSVRYFCNTSAVYFSKGLLQSDLSEFIDRYSVHGNTVFDLALGAYLFIMATSIYMMVPDLAVNIGDRPELSAMKDFDNRKMEDYSDWKWKK